MLEKKKDIMAVGIGTGDPTPHSMAKLWRSTANMLFA